MKRNNSRALARIKRIYKSVPEWWINVVKRFNHKGKIYDFKRCENFQEFLNNSKYAKRLLHTTVPYKHREKSIEARQNIKKSRVTAKKQILEGIQEFEDRYTEFDFNEIC